MKSWIRRVSSSGAGCQYEIRIETVCGQALNALKSEIVNVVSDKLVKDTVKELMGNKDFMGNFMVAVAKNWASGEDW